MSRIRVTTIVLTMVSMAAVVFGIADAGEFGQKGSPRAFHGWPNVISKTCCDDYVSKCLPSVKPVCRFTCDDYLPKCLPHVRPVCGYTCDDYCRKAPPILRCPPVDHLKCAPSFKVHSPAVKTN